MKGATFFLQYMHEKCLIDLIFMFNKWQNKKYHNDIFVSCINIVCLQVCYFVLADEEHQEILSDL